MANTAPWPRSSYLHVPFCARKCGYCNFTVVADRLDLADAYLQAIAKELDRTPGDHPVDTLYFGGGTPTQLPLAKLESLCQLVSERRPLSPGGEWTVEANPSDVTSSLAALLTEQGVTRVSLGAQSLNADKLRVLERDHAPQEVYAAVDTLRTAGLGVAVDLIFAAPGESLADWLDDVTGVIGLQGDHVSTYGLTYEQGAHFWGRQQRGELIERPEELQRAMYSEAIDRLTDARFEHYEVSNFAQPGRRSRHNEAYWLGAEYFAEGPGAARYVGGVRETNHRSTTTYLNRMLSGRSPVAEREELSSEQRARERLVFGLRRLEGINRDQFQKSTGYDLDELAAGPLSKFVAERMLVDDGASLRLSREGLMVSDALWPELL